MLPHSMAARLHDAGRRRRRRGPPHRGARGLQHGPRRRRCSIELRKAVPPTSPPSPPTAARRPPSHVQPHLRARVDAACSGDAQLRVAETPTVAGAGSVAACSSWPARSCSPSARSRSTRRTSIPAPSASRSSVGSICFTGAGPSGQLRSTTRRHGRPVGRSCGRPGCSASVGTDPLQPQHLATPCAPASTPSRPTGWCGRPTSSAPAAFLVASHLAWRAGVPPPLGASAVTTSTGGCAAHQLPSPARSSSCCPPSPRSPSTTTGQDAQHHHRQQRARSWARCSSSSAPTCCARPGSDVARSSGRRSATST